MEKAPRYGDDYDDPTCGMELSKVVNQCFWEYYYTGRVTAAYDPTVYSGYNQLLLGETSPSGSAVQDGARKIIIAEKWK